LFLCLKVLKNSDHFTEVNQRYGLFNFAWPEKREKKTKLVKPILVVSYSAHSSHLLHQGMDSRLQVVSTIFLGLKNPAYEPVLQAGCRVQDDKAAGRRVSALHKENQARITHCKAASKQSWIGPGSDSHRRDAG
jgi:hypothetical protein